MKRMVTIMIILLLSLSAFAEYKTLQLGDTGIDVVLLQDRLRELAYLGPVENGYGKKTFKAVAKFQVVAGLEMTGIADPATQEALFDMHASELYKHVFGEKDYKAILRDAKATWRDAYTVEGVVFQVFEEDKGDHINVSALVATKGETENLILVEYSRYDGGIRLLKGDYVSFDGEAHGSVEYKTLLGTNEVPSFTTYHVEIVE